VTEGRRREFKDFAAFAEAGAETAIPDPQAETTFLASRLDWAEPEREPHASMVRLYAAVLAFRHRELDRDDPRGFSADAYDADTLIISRTPAKGDHHLVVVRLRGAGMVDLGRSELATRTIAPWVAVLTSEDREFSPGSTAPVTISGTGMAPMIAFAGPAAVIFRARPGQVHMRSEARAGAIGAGTAP
jgi:maltooligosyltrehalose trehalohydrolase